MFDRKREDLMNQIRVRDAQLRDQAAQIQELAKLTKELKLSKKRRSPSFSLSEENASPPADLHSPLPNNTDLEDSDEDCAKPEVKDWMEKARESVEAGGFIVNAGLRKSFINKQDLEDSYSDTDDEDYEFVVEGDEDGDEAIVEITEDGAEGDHAASIRNSIQQRDSRSISRDRSSIASNALKNEEKLVTLPSEAAPFGLLATMAMKTNRRRQSVGSVEEENDLGVSNNNFFRPSKL